MSAGDPFLLLDLPRRFRLDEAELNGALRRASLAWHPDRFALAAAEEREAAEERMAELNRAHRVLTDPLARVGLLLGLTADDAPASPAFLLEMMERREEIEVAQAAGDGPKVEELLALLDRDLATHLNRLAAAADSGAAADDALRACFTEATYLRRSREELARAASTR